jgi:hypothetical protein
MRARHCESAVPRGETHKDARTPSPPDPGHVGLRRGGGTQALGQQR